MGMYLYIIACLQTNEVVMAPKSPSKLLVVKVSWALLADCE